MGLKNKGLVLYFMILLGLVGIVSYSKLSQSEDPPFTFKVMVIQTYWPGASAKEVSLQVTDRIEKELMTTGQYERIMAYSVRGIHGDFYCQGLFGFQGCRGCLV